MALGLLLGCGRSQKSESVRRITATNEDFPRTLTELNAWYGEPPPGQNAATLFSQGFDAMHASDASVSNLPLLGKAKLPTLGTPCQRQ